MLTTDHVRDSVLVVTGCFEWGKARGARDKWNNLATSGNEWIQDLEGATVQQGATCSVLPKVQVPQKLLVLVL